MCYLMLVSLNKQQMFSATPKDTGPVPIIPATVAVSDNPTSNTKCENSSYLYATDSATPVPIPITVVLYPLQFRQQLFSSYECFQLPHYKIWQICWSYINIFARTF